MKVATNVCSSARRHARREGTRTPHAVMTERVDDAATDVEQQAGRKAPRTHASLTIEAPGVLTFVLRNLEPKDLARAAQVSPAWRLAAEECWKPICLTHFPFTRWIHATPGCTKSWRQLYCETLLSRRPVARVPLKVCDFKFAVDVYMGKVGDVHRRLLHTGVYDISPSVVAERKYLLEYRHIELAEPVNDITQDTLFCMDVTFFRVTDGHVCSSFLLHEQWSEMFGCGPDGKRIHFPVTSYLTVPHTLPVGNEYLLGVSGWIYICDSDVDDRYLKPPCSMAGKDLVITTQQLFLSLEPPEMFGEDVMAADWFLRLC